MSRTIKGYPVYPGPRDFRPETHTLYRNNGDGTFTDVSVESGIAAHAGTGMGMVCADYDDDGDTDIFVGNDASANFLFRNDGTGHFEEVGLLSGFAYDGRGAVQGTMGVECGDYDNDGRLDFHVTSYQNELAMLYRNLGDGLFEDVTATSGAGQGTSVQVTWGNGLVDFDNDGDRDCSSPADICTTMSTNSTIGTSYLAAITCYCNTGQRQVRGCVRDQCGDGMAVKLQQSRGGVRRPGQRRRHRRGHSQFARLPTLLRNDSPPGNHWVQLLLQGTRTNRDGVGARVEVCRRRSDADR